MGLNRSSKSTQFFPSIFLKTSHIFCCLNSFQIVFQFQFQIPELIDMVLDNFIQKSVVSGLGSPQVEIMADTAVALASANVQLVAKKVIGRLCRVIDKTCTNPTQFLEQHMMWDDIAILARYLLMLSFNNCLDVARHLPYLFHTVTFLVCSGSLSMRASTHGLVINIIHSLCTCTKPSFSGKIFSTLNK